MCRGALVSRSRAHLERRRRAPISCSSWSTSSTPAAPATPAIPTLAETLRRASDRTHAAGKLHYGTGSTPKGTPRDRVDVAAFPEAKAPWQQGLIEGRSLKDLLEGARESRPPRTALIEEAEDYLGLRMRTLVTERYRLTAYSGRPYGELFDLQEDPPEYRNLWDESDSAPLRDRLRLALLDRIVESDAPLPRQTGRW